MEVSICECWAAARKPAPIMVRMTTGVSALPPNMYLNLAAWLKIWSKQTPMKSTNISSATGRRPAAAAPTAAPMKPDSLIGVSSTRVGPNFECSPLVTPSGPPQASCSPGEPVPPETSSPIRMTRESRVISWVSASLIACRKESFLAIVLLRSIGFVDVGQQGFRLRIGSRLGLGHRPLDEILRLGVDLVELRRLEQPGLAHSPPEEGQA